MTTAEKQYIQNMTWICKGLSSEVQKLKSENKSLQSKCECLEEHLKNQKIKEKMKEGEIHGDVKLSHSTELMESLCNQFEMNIKARNQEFDFQIDHKLIEEANLKIASLEGLCREKEKSIQEQTQFIGTLQHKNEEMFKVLEEKLSNLFNMSFQKKAISELEEVKKTVKEKVGEISKLESELATMKMKYSLLEQDLQMFMNSK